MEKERCFKAVVGQAMPDNASQEACSFIRHQVSLTTKSVKPRQAKPDLRRKQRGGFTLIELLVVVLIIGILAAVAVPQYQMAVAKTRLATVLPIVDTMSKAQHVYYMSNGTFPVSVDELDVDFPAGGQVNGQWLYYDNGMICGLVGSAVQCEPQRTGKLKNLTIRRYLFPQESLHNKKDFCIATSNPQQGDLAFQKKICRSLGGTAVTDIYFALDF